MTCVGKVTHVNARRLVGADYPQVRADAIRMILVLRDTLVLESGSCAGAARREPCGE